MDRERRVIGIYKGFSRVDYLELERLKQLSKSKTVPEKVAFAAIIASFGDKSVFTELSGKQHYDAQILETIYEALNEEEHKQV